MPAKKSKKYGSRKNIFLFLGLGVVLLLLITFIVYVRLSPIRIGVLLKLTGSESLPYRNVLEWARQNSGQNIQLVYVDANTPDIKKAAQPLLDDPRIQVVIGPDTSDQAMELAPLFIQKKKLLISPTATSADLYRAFAGQNYFWRTVESDVSQVQFMLHILSQKHVKKVALLYADTSYGKTFFDWTGFYATEFGITITSIQAVNPHPDYANLISDALQDNPDYIICATEPEDTVRLKKVLDTYHTGTKLFLTDMSETPSVTTYLGQEAEGLESSRPAADPDSGFDDAYRQKFHTTPPAYMATTYDSFMIAAATLARQAYIHTYTLVPLPFSEDTIRSLKTMLYHQPDEKFYRWDQMKTMLKDIESGHTPNLIGASGPITYDVQKGVDPTDTFYAYSIVKNGVFVKQLVLPSQADKTSAVDSRASTRLEDTITTTQKATLPEKKDFQAVIIATSQGWKNYRHQSDALAVYQQLRDNGVPDDKIILFITDDVPNAPQNTPRNSLYHIENGTNTYAGAQIDFSKNKVSLANLKRTLVNLNATPNTNVLLYIVDHGGSFDPKEKAGGETGGDLTQKEGIIPFANGDILTTRDLTESISQMQAEKKFRQMLVIVETCYGAAMGEAIMTPNVLFLSGASDQEVSYGANYSEKIDQWLADSFTYQFLTELKKHPQESMIDFYKNVYQNVAGSHVTLLNSSHFSNLGSTPVRDFFGK